MGRYPPRDTLTRPKLILCEGPTDEAFLRALSNYRNLPECCIRHVAEGNKSEAGGKDRIGDFLSGVPVWPGFFDLTDILIVVDSDADTGASFTHVQSEIKRAAPFGVPHRSYVIPSAIGVRQPGPPSMTVLLVPWGDLTGNLETLIYPAARHAGGANANHVDAFATITGVDGWDKETARTEMKLRALLALHQDDPFIGLGRVWSAGLIPLDHHSFAQMGDALEQFLT